MKNLFKNKDKAPQWLVMLSGIVFFVIMLCFLISGSIGLSGSTEADGVAATRSAIERAAVLCYATEGYYPPTIEYIEKYYNVQIDRSRYIVRYDASLGADAKPTISVVKM